MYIVLFSTMFEGAMYEYEVQVATSREAAKARTARLAVERYIVHRYLPTYLPTGVGVGSLLRVPGRTGYA